MIRSSPPRLTDALAAGWAVGAAAGAAVGFASAAGLAGAAVVGATAGACWAGADVGGTIAAVVGLASLAGLGGAGACCWQAARMLTDATLPTVPRNARRDSLDAIRDPPLISEIGVGSTDAAVRRPG